MIVLARVESLCWLVDVASTRSMVAIWVEGLARVLRGGGDLPEGGTTRTGSTHHALMERAWLLHGVRGVLRCWRLNQGLLLHVGSLGGEIRPRRGIVVVLVVIVG